MGLFCLRCIKFIFLKGMKRLFSLSIIMPREVRLQGNHILSKGKKERKEKIQWKG